MDSSDIINKLRDKTVFYNLQVQVSTAKVLATGTSYTFPDYETKKEYFNGLYLSSPTACVS